MYEAEVPKEFLRDAFQSGALDITGSFETVRNFVRIFRGEMDALVAINQCTFLTDKQVRELMVIAAPTAEVREQYSHWIERIHQKR